MYCYLPNKCNWLNLDVKMRLLPLLVPSHLVGEMIDFNVEEVEEVILDIFQQLQFDFKSSFDTFTNEKVDDSSEDQVASSSNSFHYLKQRGIPLHNQVVHENTLCNLYLVNEGMNQKTSI